MDKKTPKNVLERKRKYYKNNKQRRLRYQKDRYWKNREEILAARKQRKLDDPEFAAKERAYHKEYYAKRKASLKNAQADPR
tara:strand:- start:1659 stop:1901 length:243 start_codon:yes stop_codon:yes gene_type:complete